MTKNDSNNGLMTIDELAAATASALSDVDQASGRVSDVPSRRTIRYYAQHGLLDVPIRFEGRTALYGERHLLQLVAIKRMQSRGDALAIIQSRIVGATDETLQALAEMASRDEKDTAPASRRQSSFWADEPAPVSAPRPQASPESGPVSGARLDEDVLLVLENLRRELHVDDIEAIRVAAEPLLKVLHARHLLNTRSE